MQEIGLRQAREVTASLLGRGRAGRLPLPEIQDMNHDDSLSVTKRPTNIANNNAFRAMTQSTHRGFRPIHSLCSKKRYRTRSPDTGVYTFGTDRNNHLSANRQRGRATELANQRDIKAEAGNTPGLAQQEEEDRRFAERLQEEEHIIAETRSSSRPSMTRERALTKFRGANSNPIDLSSITSISASPRKVRRSEDQVFDGIRNFQSETPQDRMHDAELARHLQEEECRAQDERNRQAALRTHDCVVCGDNTLFIELPSLSSCSHQPEVCGGCYASWIASQLGANGWQEAKCPGTSCKINLAYAEIKAYASIDVFERYDALKARSVLASDPNFRWCRAEGCVSGQIHDVEEVGNQFVCVECHARFCIVHEGPYHDNETCDEYEYRTSGRKERDERKEEEMASEEAVRKSTKLCPGQICGWPIEKNGGCAHMSCMFTPVSVRVPESLTRCRPKVQTPILLDVSEGLAHVQACLMEECSARNTC